MPSDQIGRRLRLLLNANPEGTRSFGTHKLHLPCPALMFWLPKLLKAATFSVAVTRRARSLERFLEELSISQPRDSRGVQGGREEERRLTQITPLVPAQAAMPSGRLPGLLRNRWPAVPCWPLWSVTESERKGDGQSPSRESVQVQTCTELQSDKVQLPLLRTFKMPEGPSRPVSSCLGFPDAKFPGKTLREPGGCRRQPEKVSKEGNTIVL